MKRFLLLALCAPLILGACSKSTTDEPTPTPTLPAGTKDDPIGINLLSDAVGKTAVWIEGYIVGAETEPAAMSVPKAATRNNVLLADKADETDAAKCIRLDLTDGSDIQARLNIVDHPTLVGSKIKIQGDVTQESTGSGIKIANITAEEGGQDPVVTPPDEPEPPVIGTVELDKLYGYAEGTTGGEGATAANTHHFNDGKKFCAWLALREKNKDKTPTIVWLSGKFTKTDGRDTSSPWFDIKRTENISIYGTNDFVMENVGFFLNEVKNIIIRNIYIKMPKADNGADGISMQESNNIWVDHCTFESVNQSYDYEDGSCDITHGTYNVTVSWNHFIKTQKSCLVGHSNSQTSDDQIKVTFHHNYFDLSSSRHPRVRFGKAHVYNNFYNQVTTYGAGSAYNAKVLLEYNNFKGVALPTDICTFPAKKSGSSWVSNLTGSVAGFLYERGNTYTDKLANSSDPYPFTNVEFTAYGKDKLPTPLTFDDFKPTYQYTVDDAEQIAAIVPAGAGVGVMQGYIQAPIAADNGGIADPSEPTDPSDPSDPEQPGGSELGNGWMVLSNGAASATTVTNGGALTLTAMGKFESGKQVFGIVYREVSGDFVLTAQIDSYETPGTGNQSLAGLILTPDASAADNNFLHAMTAAGPASTFYYSNRATIANAGKGALGAPAVTTGVKPILRLERAGEKCTASYSLDGGVTFGANKSVTFSGLTDKLQVGVAVNSGNTTKTATAVFSNVILNNQTLVFSEN